MSDVFVERARHLSAARDLVAGDTDYTSALALLAVHSAISWNDAILTRLIGRAQKGENHMRAALALEGQCAARKMNREGVKHLKRLIEAKSKISYGDQRTTPEAALSLSVSAERFERWAIQVLRRFA
jgi:hypothetical protein